MNNIGENAKETFSEAMRKNHQAPMLWDVPRPFLRQRKYASQSPVRKPEVGGRLSPVTNCFHIVLQAAGTSAGATAFLSQTKPVFKCRRVPSSRAFFQRDTWRRCTHPKPTFQTSWKWYLWQNKRYPSLTPVVPASTVLAGIM